MTAVVDGAPWSAHELSVAAIPGQSGLFTITGADNSSGGSVSINLALYNVRGPGAYPLGVSFEIVGGWAQYSTGGVVWATPYSGAAGVVNITTLTPTRIAGTFEYVAELSSGSSGTQSHTITNGQFDLPMTTTSGTLPTVPEQAGSIIRATIGGNAFNAASGFATTSHMGNGLGFNAHDLVYQLSLSLAGITTAGTYTLSQSSNRLINISGLGQGSPVCCWGLQANGSGTVTITSVTATRLKGTFSATLYPQAGSGQTGTLAITNGTFDIGR